MTLPDAVAGASPTWADHGMDRCWAATPAFYGDGLIQCSVPVPHPSASNHVGLCPEHLAALRTSPD